MVYESKEVADLVASLRSQIREQRGLLLGLDLAVKSRAVAHYEHVFLALIERGIRAEQAHEQALSAKALLLTVMEQEASVHSAFPTDDAHP